VQLSQLMSVEVSCTRVRWRRLQSLLTGLVEFE